MFHLDVGIRSVTHDDRISGITRPRGFTVSKGRLGTNAREYIAIQANIAISEQVAVAAMRQIRVTIVW